MARCKVLLFLLIAALLVATAGYAADAEPAEGPAQPTFAFLTKPDRPLNMVTEGLGEIEIAVMQDDLAELDDDFADSFTLTVSWDGGEKTAEYAFQSSYGLFRLEIIDLTRNGTPEMVLVTGEGRGTSVRSETLEILSLDEGAITPAGTAGYSAFFGSGARWWYEHEYVDMDDDGTLEVVLHQHHTPIGEGEFEKPETIPPDKVIVLRPTLPAEEAEAPDGE